MADHDELAKIAERLALLERVVGVRSVHDERLHLIAHLAIDAAETGHYGNLRRAVQALKNQEHVALYQALHRIKR